MQPDKNQRSVDVIPTLSHNNNNSTLNISSLKCLYTNATSLINKWDAFNSRIISESFPHLLMITETWFKQNTITNLDNYTLFSNNRSIQPGGGVAIYVRDDVRAFEANHIINPDPSTEQIWCSITTATDSILIGCIYRPPLSSREINLSIGKSISKACNLIKHKKFSSLLLAGDFNFSDITWDSCSAKVKGKGRPSSNEFIDLLNSQFLHQHVIEPTFGLNTLDLVITDTVESVYCVKVVPPLSSSDKNRLHAVLIWDLFISSKISNSPTRKVINKNGNYVKFCDYLEAIDWDSALNDSDINKNYGTLLSIYNKGVSEFIPTFIGSTCHQKVSPKWFNKSLKQLTTLKYKRFRASKCAPNNQMLRTQYRSICLILKRSLKLARLQYEYSIIRFSKQNPKLIYSYINHQKNSADKIRSLVNGNGDTITDKTVIATMLNDQFFANFSIDSLNTPPESIICPQTLCEVDPEEVFSRLRVQMLLKELNKHKSPGTDQVHPYVLNECSDSFAGALAKIFKQSYLTSSLPTYWKEANVTPVFKRGSKTDPSNYRPISLTAVPCKVMETIVLDIMMNHLIKNNLITSEQHGFVQRKSCETNLLEALDIVTDAASHGFSTIMVFLDFAKAFDKVSHKALISKLEAYGFSGLLLQWLKEFLSDRKQRVVLGQASSSWSTVTSGVPQGSVLGPLLFTLFINDMPKHLHHPCKLFADDTKLIAIIKNTQDIVLLQEDIDRLSAWNTTWDMKFNHQKCKYMVFNKKKHFRSNCVEPELTIKIPELETRHTLEQIACEKDLGVHFTNDLKWRTQCTRAAAKANSVLGQLRHAFKAWNIRTFNTLYTAFVRPHLEYAAPVWNPHKTADIKIIETIQRRATKLVPAIKNLDYHERLNVLGLTTLEERRMRGDLISYYKISNGLNNVNFILPTSTANSIICDGPANSIRGHNKRIHAQVTKCQARFNFLPNRVVAEWNKLDQATVDAETVSIFKGRLDKENKLKRKR